MNAVKEAESMMIATSTDRGHMSVTMTEDTDYRAKTDVLVCNIFGSQQEWN